MAAGEREWGRLRRSELAMDEAIKRSNWKYLQSCRLLRNSSSISVVFVVVGVAGGCYETCAEGCKDLKEEARQRFCDGNLVSFQHQPPSRDCHIRTARPAIPRTSSNVVSSISPSRREPTLAAAAPRPACIFTACTTRPLPMAPPCPNFPTRQLTAAAQIGADGKIRKTADGRRIDLAKDCELFGLVQYECIVQQPALVDSPVQCWPVQRWFRR